MRVLLDMNLSPVWAAYLVAAGHECVHWGAVGDPRASDQTVMSWALNRGYIVFTHDLDYSALLASTGAGGPSVVQVRGHDVLPDRVGAVLLRVLHEHAAVLGRGAIVTLDPFGMRVRVLPIERPGGRG